MTDQTTDQAEELFPEIATPEGMEGVLDALDKEASDLSLQSTVPAGEYLMKIRELKPAGIMVDGRPAIEYFTLNGDLAYSVATEASLQKSVSSRFYEFSKKNKGPIKDATDRRARLIASIIVAAEKAGTPMDSAKLREEQKAALALYKQGAEGYSTRDVLEGAKDLYVRVTVQVDEQEGYEPRNSVPFYGISPLTPADFAVLEQLTQA